MVRAVCEDTPRRASTAVTEIHEEPTVDGKTRTTAPGMLSATREGTPMDLKRRLTGDLDSILSRSLEKQPEERYRSAEQLSSDLERHLEGRRILASPAGAFQQITRFVSRHRLPLVLGAGVVAAFASGAIRIEWTAILYLGAAILLLGLWVAGTNRRIGASIHNRLFYGTGKFIGILVLILGLSSPCRTGAGQRRPGGVTLS